MAITLTHTTVAVGTDAGNGEIRKAQWNENHTLTMATNKLLGRATAGDGAVEEIDCTAAGRALLDDADAAAQRTTLGVGTGDSPTFTGLTLTGVATLSAGTALLPSLTTSGDLNTGMWFPAADTVAWSTGGTERLRINSSGNVGIGTSSPSQKLDVSGSIITSQSITIGTGGSFAAGSIASNVNWGMYFQAKQASPALGHFVWTTSAAVELLRINSSGVLILGSGEASATVAGNTLRAPSSSGTNIAGGNLTIAGGAGTGTGGGGHIAFQTAAAGSTGSTANTLTERLRITSAGNFGINTTAPDALLSVNGIASFGAGAVATPSIAAFGDLNTGFWFPAADTIAASTAGSERLRVDANGNVVINTAAIATAATDGFLYVPSCAGTPTGTPTTFTGRVPIVVDTTNNKLYFYSGGQWRDAGP